MTSFYTKEFVISQLSGKQINKVTFQKLSALQNKCTDCEFLFIEGKLECRKCYLKEFDADIAEILMQLREIRLKELDS